MVNIPIRFNRVAAAFDEVARKSCESSGSEHSVDLSDLLYSFHEREVNEHKVTNQGHDPYVGENEIEEDDEIENKNSEVEIQDSLKSLFSRGNDVVKWSIYKEVETALEEVKVSSLDFKRGLMAQLREKGFDAGLCKSKWEKNGRCPKGEYEYIDINASGTRYIIEVSLAGEFTIARPTVYYASLIKLFPPVSVCEAEELKKVVRLMCNAIQLSMTNVRIHIPPWRRLAYLQAKWFGSYKRTTNEISNGKGSSFGVNPLGNRSIGFVPMMGISFNCREDFGAKNSARTGNFAAALKG